MRFNVKDTITHISYNEEEGYKVTVFLETKKGLVTYNIKNANFISSYPLLAKKLIEGKKLYLDSCNGYIGTEQKEETNAEEVFISEYESNNSNFNELLTNMEQNIKIKKETPKKLVKSGPRYINSK